jgi:subtilisin family serine protease
MSQIQRVRAAAAAAALAVVVAGLPLGAQAATDPAGRFEQLPLPENMTFAAQVGTKSETVVLKLAGDSVAESQAKAPGRKLDASSKGAIRSGLKGQHDALKPAIAQAGGTVLGDYGAALNGIKVSIAPERVSALARLRGVVAVKPLALYQVDNSVSVPFIGAPQAWEAAGGLRGEGVRVGIIDTGIDYTHANFAGPGTAAAYAAAHAAAVNGDPPDPSQVGPGAPKVKGGIDLVGDDYDAGSSDPAKRIPHPRPDPIDCGGHGSHVAGTAAGLGVNSDGTTYTGPYDTTTHANPFRIGPGVAPQADLYAIKVFGCAGSTNVVVDAFDWAVDNDMQVVNLSLGSSYGRPDDASAEAASNAAAAGILVVQASGNAGPAPYITGSPGLANRTISVAAVDSTASFAGFNVALSTGPSVQALSANGAAFTGPALPVVVLRQPNGTISLGCSESEYPDALVAGKLVVTQRGVCARVDRAIFGQRHNAAAVAMINTDAGFGVFEGPIPGVTIPFLGIKPADGAALIGADGGTATLTSATVANPTFRGFAGFSSQGPRRLDSHLKPDISAPGVAVRSTAVGTGNNVARMSGTSMATPHVAGVAALARQAHPDWSQDDVRAAIVNTALSSEVAGFSISRGGGGLVQPLRSILTSVVAMGEDFETNLSFGFEEFTADFSGSRKLNVRNNGDSAVTFSLSTQGVGGSPHSTRLSAATLTIPAGAAGTVDLTLNVPAATVGSTSAFREVSGFVTLTPVADNNNNNSGISLSVPYYLVPRGRSNITTDLDNPIGPNAPDATATVRNDGGARAADADFYAWGLAGTEKGLGPIGLRAVGVQSNPRPGFPDDRILVFAINTFERWSTPNVLKFEILIDTTGSGMPDYKIVGEDLGQLQNTGHDDQGRMGAAVINLGTNTGVIRFTAPAPKDGSTIELPVRASDLGLTASKPRFSYTATSSVFRTESTDTDAITQPGSFNAFVPAITQGQDPTVAPNGTATVKVSINPVEWEQTPALGLMVVTLDNRSGADQAQLIAAVA